MRAPEEMGFEALIDTIKGAVGGFSGIFVISLVSNSIPFVGIPYLAIVAGYATIYTSPIDRALLIVSSAAGAALGKIVIYFLGSAVRLKLSKESEENLRTFLRLAKRSMFLAIVIFASTPLPDDLLYVPLGVMRYPLPQYFLAILMGKVILTTVVIYYLGWVIEQTVNSESPVVSAATITFTVYLTYLALKINWGDVLNELEKRGVLGATAKVLREAIRLTWNLARYLAKLPGALLKRQGGRTP